MGTVRGVKVGTARGVNQAKVGTARGVVIHKIAKVGTARGVGR